MTFPFDPSDGESEPLLGRSERALQPAMPAPWGCRSLLRPVATTVLEMLRSAVERASLRPRYTV